ncbi:uncharacterized protein DS421_18g609160 [Arachis hypogaea]|nr:uncharacterized protein DS421_18g609160 [Arachis hypogaea]
MAAMPLAAGIGIVAARNRLFLVVVEPPELFAATGLLSGRFGIAAVPLYYFVSLWLLRMWLEAEVAVVDDFGLRRKGLCDAFELWNLRFELNCCAAL